MKKEKEGYAVRSYPRFSEVIRSEPSLLLAVSFSGMARDIVGAS
jgi:hypothetical protein